MSESYSREDLEQILQIASQKNRSNEHGEEFTSKELEEAAMSAGIEPHHLEAAKQQLRHRKDYESDKKRALASYNRLRRWGVFAHLIPYLTTVGGLFLLDYLTAGGPWWHFPAIGWGIGVALHLWRAVAPVSPEKTQRLVAKLREKEAKRAARDERNRVGKKIANELLQRAKGFAESLEQSRTARTPRRDEKGAIQLPAPEALKGNTPRPPSREDRSFDTRLREAMDRQSSQVDLPEDEAAAEVLSERKRELP